MGKKFQTGAPYHLHAHFSSPLRDFLDDEENEKIGLEIMEKWIQPNIPRTHLQTPQDIFFEFMYISQIGLPYKRQEDGLYVSGMFLIIKRIVSILISKLPESFTPDPIIRLLSGYMYHHYYSIGEEGEEFFEKLFESLDIKEQGGTWGEEHYETIFLRNTIIPNHLEEISKRKVTQEMKRVANILDNIDKGKDFILNDDDFNAIESVTGKGIKRLKVSKEGIDFAKRNTYSEKEAKRFKKIRIERGSSPTIVLLTAIITNIYFGKELFLYYNPELYEMGICDRASFNITNPQVYLYLNFGEIVNAVFCKNCMADIIGENRIKFSNNKQKNKEIIKKMFDELYKITTNICPDDLNITVEGLVRDNNRYLEVTEAIEYGEVGFNKYKGKKKGVAFSINKNLKKNSKKLQ